VKADAYKNQRKADLLKTMKTKQERKLILIVDDEPDTAWLLEYHLERSGFRIICASNGLDALDTAFRCKPDLVILDLMLPELHGLEVCRCLKSNPLTQHVPVILLTAYSTLEDKLQGFGRGADDFMTKPFEISELIVRVFALLRRYDSALLVGEGNDNPAGTNETSPLLADATSDDPHLADAASRHPLTAEEYKSP
jgi:DNA-binding response OmpR family regulator